MRAARKNARAFATASSLRGRRARAPRRAPATIRSRPARLRGTRWRRRSVPSLAASARAYVAVALSNRPGRRGRRRARRASSLAGCRADALELQLEELLHHVELAEIPVDRARRFEALDERGFSLYASWKCLSAFTPERNFRSRLARAADGSSPSAAFCASPRDTLLELLDEPLPVVGRLEKRKTILLIHGSLVVVLRTGRVEASTRASRG